MSRRTTAKRCEIRIASLAPVFTSLDSRSYLACFYSRLVRSGIVAGAKHAAAARHSFLLAKSSDTMKVIASAIAVIAFAHGSLATVAFSAPVASSNLKAGSSFKLTWRDDGVAPSLATFGQTTFSLGVGGSVQQVLLQTLGTADVSKVNSLSINIDADVGQSAQGSYFIRADSATKGRLQDSASSRTTGPLEPIRLPVPGLQRQIVRSRLCERASSPS